ncbi:MAG: hypothetical protein ACK47B_02630 [Armatimonadota bacterium]
MGDDLLYGKSSILGAMCWMFGLSLLLSLVLGWIPVVGPFIGPIVGGYIGGRRAGTVRRALAAAVLPAALLSLFILALGAAAAAWSQAPGLGVVAAVLAGAAWLILLIHNAALFLAALVGGLTRQGEPY